MVAQAVSTVPAVPRRQTRGQTVIKWVTSTDHKTIGYMYLITSFIFFCIGGLMALVIRAELFEPGIQVVQSKEQYNELFTMHGTIMLLLFATPLFAGFANVLMPMQIGAPDVAFPRLNMFAYWLYLFGGLIAAFGFFTREGAASFGWFAYAPLSSNAFSPGLGADLWVFGLTMGGFGTILGAVNFMTTIITMRAPGMTMFRMPIFTWNTLITSLLVLMAFPPLAAALFALGADRKLGAHIFDPTNGGAILWQHLFWFFGHPEVYILLLPVWGLMPHVLATFSRKPTYGYTAQVYAFIAIGVLSVVVWAHHFFTAGLPVPALVYFMFSTMAISVPLAVLFFCWIATMWKGAMSFETPMLFAVGFIVLFGIAGLTGLILADVAADAQYHHSYFVVAHFHYALFAGGIMGVMTGVYYWLPKWTGHMYSETLGKWHFWLTVASFNLTFMPQFFLGLAGMPRRIPDYALQFAEFNAISTVGAFVLGLSQLLFAWNIWSCVRGGPKADGRAWEGAEGLEWELSSPPPHHSWETQPVIK